MYHYKVPGYILWGILLTWILGMIAQACGWYVVDPTAGANSLFPDFSNGIGISAPYLFAFNFDYISSHLIEFAVIVFAFLFVDLFDTAGTVIGVANRGGMLDENGDLPRAKQVLLADAVGTVVGSCLGTSTVTSFVESSAGVAAGGRTRACASVATGVLFLVALVLAPIFLAIPSFATTPALVFVGFLMMSSVKDMDWSKDSAAAVGGFLAIIMMPFTYSIANGIMFGMPCLRRDPHLPRARQGGPLGHVGFYRAVRAARSHARRLEGHSAGTCHASKKGMAERFRTSPFFMWSRFALYLAEAYMDDKRQETRQDPKPRARALLPIAVFLALYLGSGIYFEYIAPQDGQMGFYVISVVVAFASRIDRGILPEPPRGLRRGDPLLRCRSIGDDNITIMLSIFLMAGAFSGIASTAGGVGQHCSGHAAQATILRKPCRARNPR